MKIKIKKNGNFNIIKEFKNKENLLDFASKLIRENGYIENNIQKQILNKNIKINIKDIITNIDYKLIKRS